MNPLRFVPVAKAMAELSRDPSTKVGAVVIDSDANILSTAFNGFPRGVIDSQERYAQREIKLSLTAHAEANAIAQAARTGAKLFGSTLIVTALYPCSNCAKLIIQSGIKKVYAPKMDATKSNQQWFFEKEIAELLFLESGIEVIEYE